MSASTPSRAGSGHHRGSAGWAREEVGGIGLDAAELATLEGLCIAFAVRAARFVRDERPGDGLGARTKSTDTDVVTVMDERSEQLLRELIVAARPDDAVLGEEGMVLPGTSGLTWVVDPIDGTVNYLYGLPSYSVSVAVVVGDPHIEGAWYPIAGAVADPSRRVVFHAALDGGAWVVSEDEARDVARDVAGVGVIEGVGRVPLQVSGETRLGQTLLATGFAYSAQVRREQALRMVEVLVAVRDIRRIGSAALDLCRVAEGQVDAFVEATLNAWDIAAGWLVVVEAGGLVGGIEAGGLVGGIEAAGLVGGVGDEAEGLAAPGKALTVAAPPALYEQVRALFVP